MIQIAKTKFYTDDEDTWNERRAKILSFEKQCYHAQQNYNANLFVLRELMELQKDTESARVLAKYKEEIALCEMILAKQASNRRIAIAKKMSFALMALGAIATVGYAVMSMKRNK